MKRPNQLILFTPQSYCHPSPCPPCEAPSSREIRTLHQVRIPHEFYRHGYIIAFMAVEQRLIFGAPRRDICTGAMFLVRLYLHHPDIDGATIFAHHGESPALTIYFNAATCTPSGRHGAVILARPGAVSILNIFLYGCFEQ